jgi:hypothetical protein
MLRRTLLAAVMFACVGCEPLPPPEPHELVRPATPGAFVPDPTDRAILGVYETFALGRGLHGEPARVARSVAYLEFLAADFRTMRWASAPGISAPALQVAKSDLRAALGLQSDASAQAVIDAMQATADALDAGDRAGAERALTGPVFVAPAGTVLGRLSDMPRLAGVASGALAAWEARFRAPDDGCQRPC